ncbi:hypothetical protein [Methylobacterium sp. EM32]|uniref:hypothetical protein n=1 Tax=Methylobacterium sp. EM32 TaxID=3163481 RepID=UPI0038B30AFE
MISRRTLPSCRPGLRVSVSLLCLGSAHAQIAAPPSATIPSEAPIALDTSPMGSCAAEAVTGLGHDWLLVDTEPSPSDPLTGPQSQAVAPYTVCG